MTRPVASQRFRQRKLNTRTALEVIREDQLDAVVDPDQQNAQKVETGVEKHEETEHHLQAAISASQAAAVGGNVAQIYIPTPQTVQSALPYKELYSLGFSKPATYIRFSSTVEDCTGCPYNMAEEDDDFLKQMNEKAATTKTVATQCSEDQFEEVMNFFEVTAKAQQPFSAVGDAPPPVLTWEDMFNAFDENIDEPARVFAKDIYAHWHARRSKAANEHLQPALKLKVIETTNDADDNDPYVCFRRREMRQVRKTRGRDAQSVEKLKKLRKELEEARHLVALVKQRELLKRDSLAIDRQLYEQRMNLRQVKRKLPDQFKDGDEDLLVNQKPKKQPPPPTALQRPPISQIRIPPHAGRPSEADLVLLSDVLAEKENAIQREIKEKIRQHQKWNEHYVDLTQAPLSPPPEELFNSFRPAVTQYLPTPPASVSSEHSGDAMEIDTPRKQEAVSVRYAAPSPDGPNRNQPAFRRRIGRGGRVMIDRRGMQQQAKTISDARIADRFKYDVDDDEDVPVTYTVDPYDISSMRYRAAISGSHPSNSQAHQQAQALRRLQLEHQQATVTAQQNAQAAAAAGHGSAESAGHRKNRAD